MRLVSLDELAIDDERSFAHVALYGRLKRALGRSRHQFHVPGGGASASWDRVVFLNLTYWSGADVLCDQHIAADVVAHVAWHDVVRRELERQNVAGVGRPPAAALFFAESIASAFDLYLIGRLLPNAPGSDFITTQVPLISDCAQAGGLSEAAVARLLQDIARDPERAFEDMRSLLLDVCRALFVCPGPVDAEQALDRFAGHRFEPLLHHYQLSNWILYARAYAGASGSSAAASAAQDAAVQRTDAILRQAPVALDWLADNWIDADLPPGG
jgi:hypothetical protein